MKNMGRFAFLVTLIFCLSIFINTSVLGAPGFCPPLPPPAGATVTVDSAQALYSAVNNATSGSTILIADGTYNLGGNGYFLWIDTPGVTLRSASGDRSSVILDDNYSGSETITIAASNVTIADLTIMRSRTHPIHVVSTDTGDTVNTLIYNIHIIDPGEQAIKINPHSAKTNFTDDGVVACSTMELTDEGRAKVLEFTEHCAQDGCPRCYTGGVDAHQSRGWVVRDNVIEGFWCQLGLSEHGVHFWTGSRDTVVERNMLIDNARGIGFGLRENGSGRTYSDDPCSGAIGHVGHFDGIIRNNFIFASHAPLFSSQASADGGIALAQACGAQVVHNTVAFTQAPFAAIEWRFVNTDAELTNNLVTHNLMDRGGTANLTGNLSSQPLSLFVDGANGDLHLADGADVAIDKAAALSPGLCDDDFDGQARPAGAAGDIGADEYNSVSGNTAPVVEDLWVTVEENATDISVTLSGSDADGDRLTYTVMSDPTNGSLAGTAPNLYYTPGTGYVGSDTFSYMANDGTTDSAVATVHITVEAVRPSNTPSTSGNGGSSDGCFIGICGR